MDSFLYIAPSFLQLGYIAGTVFALVDLAQRNVEGKVWWIIAIIFFPFAWIIYLVMARNVPKKVEQFSHTQQPPVPPASPENPPAQQIQNPVAAEATPVAPAAVVPAVQQSKTGGALKTVGMVLGVIALVSGVVIVGLFILLLAAISSYGSNK